MLAVTTRNRLPSARFCIPMLLARREIARQLEHQPGLLHYASGITSPTEFFTLTVWRDRESMQRFMQSGAHERNMWQFTRWTSSFWGMRWDPLADPTPPQVSPLVTAGLLAPHAVLAGPLGPRPVGAVVEPRRSGITCVTAIFEGVRSSLRLRTAASGLRVGQREDARLLRWAVGMDLPPRGLIIALWDDAAESCVDVVGDATWVSTWQTGDYEIGHWDGLRLRQAARRRMRDRVEL